MNNAIVMNTSDNSKNSSTATICCASLSSALPTLSPAATLTSVVSTPRVGVEFKDRIFVGGFPPGTTDVELRNFFSKYGIVREAKIIRDHTGISKGYGFITYETEEEARRVRESCGGFTSNEHGSYEDMLDFKGRKLNVGPAIRKASNRAQNLDVIPQGAVVLAANGMPYVIQNGMTLCANPESYAVAHPAIGNTFPFFMPPQFVLAPAPQYVMPSSLPIAAHAMPQGSSVPSIPMQPDLYVNQHLNQSQHFTSPTHGSCASIAHLQSAQYNAPALTNATYPSQTKNLYDAMPNTANMSARINVSGGAGSSSSTTGHFSSRNVYCQMEGFDTNHHQSQQSYHQVTQPSGSSLHVLTPPTTPIPHRYALQ